MMFRFDIFKCMSKRTRWLRLSFILITLFLGYYGSEKSGLFTFSNVLQAKVLDSSDRITGPEDSKRSPVELFHAGLSRSTGESENIHFGRHLLGVKKNTSNDPLYPPGIFSVQEKQRGAVICYIVGTIYMFTALAIVCDDFFVPALEVIIEDLSLSEDVAGATFMAAGGSAPELFTSLIGVFLAKSDVGIGTIVGSAVFNILFVIGMCAIVSKDILRLTWWPLYRDVSFYSISLLLLIYFFIDEIVEWWESLILFCCYGMYTLFMKFNQVAEFTFKSCLKRCPCKHVKLRRKKHSRGHRSMGSLGRHYRPSIANLMIRSSQGGLEVIHLEDNTDQTDTSITTPHERKASSTSEVLIDGRSSSEVDGIRNVQPPPEKIHGPQVIETADDKVDGGSSDDENAPLDLSWPETNSKRITYVLVAPIVFSLWLTMPDVRRPGREKYYPISFIGSILWIAMFSYLMVWWAKEVGETFGIKEEVMGLTILAAGTSIPDLITSVIVAKKGFGDMAVSSSVGSNIFDITIGLPIPWLLYAVFNNGKPYEVSSDGLLCAILLLFLMLLTVVTTIALSGWKMSKILGFSMLLLYLIFLTISVLLAYNFIRCPTLKY